MNEHTHDWKSYVLMMAKHKCLEKMQEMNKQDTDELDDEDFCIYKDCAKTIFYIKSIEEAMKEQSTK